MLLQVVQIIGHTIGNKSWKKNETLVLSHLGELAVYLFRFGKTMVGGDVDLKAVVITRFLAAIFALVLEHVGEMDAFHVVHGVAALGVDLAANSTGEPLVGFGNVVEQNLSVLCAGIGDYVDT